jgi:hypothetical protein
MLRSAIVTLMLAGLATVAAAETVYKWVDTGGQVHYTDRPPTESGAKLIGVFDRALILEEEEAATESSPPAEEEPAGSTPASTAAAVERDVQQARSTQCKQAQERYQKYVESQRLFRQTPDGKREYLSDAELSQARIDARKAVDELCK